LLGIAGFTVNWVETLDGKTCIFPHKPRKMGTDSLDLIVDWLSTHRIYRIGVHYYAEDYGNWPVLV
jgi:hypothetical protein